MCVCVCDIYIHTHIYPFLAVHFSFLEQNLILIIEQYTISFIHPKQTIKKSEKITQKYFKRERKKISMVKQQSARFFFDTYSILTHEGDVVELTFIYKTEEEEREPTLLYKFQLGRAQHNKGPILISSNELIYGPVGPPADFSFLL